MSKVLRVASSRRKTRSEDDLQLLQTASDGSKSSSKSSKTALDSSPVHSAENDRLIKSLLKQYKHLELELNRFNSKKYNPAKNSGVLKSNILRTSLLPFLRSGHKLHRYFPKHSKVYKSLTSVITAILLKWWTSLLANLKTTGPLSTAASTSAALGDSYSTIPASDRNAYLECISRIVALDDWSKVDDDFFSQYSSLLTSTLEYCIDKMTNLKTLSLSVSAFVGKIFAYSFFTLPHVSNALLFLLNVKQSFFESTSSIITPSSASKASVDHLKSIFPLHLHHLINFQGIRVASKKQAGFLNCVPPPAHPVNGIKDPNGSWVRRWCNCDSNVFNSFFRHYVDIIQKRLSDGFDPDATDLLLVNCPGFNVIFSHILQIFKISITKISTTTVNKFLSLLIKASPPPVPPTPTSGINSAKSNAPPTPPPFIPGLNVKHCDVYYNSIVKIFKTIRDILHSASFTANRVSSSASTCREHEDLISYSLVKFVDRLFVSISKETSVYDSNKNGLILNIVYEFINHVFNNMNSSPSAISWEFWLSCNYMMLKHTDHIQVVLKNLSFLFNIWDMVPESLSSLRQDLNLGNVELAPPYLNWITNLNESYKANFIDWLISNEIFQRYFIHWNPIVRSYYARFLVWRLIGVNNYHSSTMIQVTRRIEQKLDKAYDVLHAISLKNQHNGTVALDYTPDNPLVNRKFGILPINLKEDGGLNVHDDSNPDFIPATSMKISELRKTHSYEIFDEAIYTCSSLPSTAEDNTDNIDSKKHPSKSLVSSLGKLFKYLSTEDNNNTDTRSNGLAHRDRALSSNSLKYKRNSVSLSSLSTTYSSIKSRSSSPSLMSFKSTPTSVSDSTTSSISDLDSFSPEKSSQKHNQPPEIFKLPPEISRPIYKFDIIIDHDSMNQKYLMIHQKNLRVELRADVLGDSEDYYSTNLNQPVRGTIACFPSRPQVPHISIFINNDPYNKFYINDEDGLFMENLNKDDDSDARTIQSDDIDELFSDMKLGDLRPKNLIDIVNLGRSLNELNLMIEEFKAFLNRRIEIDQFNQDLEMMNDLNEFDYFKKIIPFLSVDSSNELKLLNAN
ncbi:DUF1765-domain-containing protein [Suhomyces tanzawaensis NRRL Y-17324]|uniref:DUF1765-domain-containing protein n=1 Tax=Suhomyces tanzawaensis NRRL Y-17324 TaxID=984487 RepID=A0A1E4SGF8_9ASCO|nr:DUF1765-domain-containing protein [Suhomyces tanzawaensis NRRL Y-17324]ODV78594.1 DUF1765-domain-containing protein [Suhomyces tanzawaensis NRRL Y-17324]